MWWAACLTCTEKEGFDSHTLHKKSCGHSGWFHLMTRLLDKSELLFVWVKEANGQPYHPMGWCAEKWPPITKTYLENVCGKLNKPNSERLYYVGDFQGNPK